MIKKIIGLLIFVLFFCGQAWTQTPPEVMAQFQGMNPEATFIDDDGVQRFVVSCADSFYSVWWIYPDSLPDSATAFVSDSATDFSYTIIAVTDTFNVNDEMVGEWFGTTNYHVGFVAFQWKPTDWDVEGIVFGPARLFRVEVSKSPPPQSPQIQFLSDPE